jgi:aBig family protein
MKSKFNLIKITLLMLILSIAFTGCFLFDDDISAAAKSVAKDKADLEIIYAGGDSAASVTRDVTLATAGSSITIISWLSSNTSIITNDGTVIHPYGSSNVTVTLTATISKENKSDTKDFILIVIDDPYNFIVGDIGPAGGWIFYINPNAVVDRWKYLEAAPLPDQRVSQNWIEGGATQTTENGNTNTGIGTGLANTSVIVAQLDHTDSAAKVCLDYTVDNGGSIYNDWFLPSKDELNLMYVNLHQEGVGGFVDGDSDQYYWSSSEIDASIAWSQRFYNSFQDYTKIKSTLSRVRAVRVF